MRGRRGYPFHEGCRRGQADWGESTVAVTVHQPCRHGRRGRRVSNERAKETDSSVAIRRQCSSGFRCCRRPRINASNLGGRNQRVVVEPLFKRVNVERQFGTGQRPRRVKFNVVPVGDGSAVRFGNRNDVVGGGGGIVILVG